MSLVFTKGDLVYTDYKWTAYPTDDPRITGKPDSTYLNRGEGYEIVYFIDRYMRANNWSNKNTGQKIEKFLKTSKSGKQSHTDWRKELSNNFSL